MTDVHSTTILKHVDHIYPELVKLRRNLHQDPEAGFAEFRTTDKIIRFLQDKNVKNIQRPLPTGLTADIIRKGNSSFIALRADIDALPIADLKTVSYHSRNEGLCHACGHDIHSAVVAGIGAVCRMDELKLQHNIRLIFQPAEEPIPSGAPRMIANGALENVETIWAMHVDPTLPLGKVGLTPGWVNAQSIRLHWQIAGKGGHSARPYLAINPITAGSLIIERVNKYMDHHRQSVTASFAFSFTQFLSGSAYNAIPDRAEILGTLRVTDGETHQIVHTALQEINRQVESDSGVTVNLSVQEGSPPVINDKKIISHFIKNDVDQYGINLKPEEDFRSMGGDDFGWYVRHVPGAMIRFGVADGNDAPAVHTGWFDAPEEVIRLAVLFFTHQILNWPDKIFA